MNYKNGPEEMKRIPRMPDAVLDCIIRDSLFYGLANRYEGENLDRLHGLMHDTAEEVLARVSIAAPSVASGAQPKPVEMTDAQIREIWCGLGGQDSWLRDFGFIQFARAILANSAPNKALVEALQKIERNEMAVFDEDLDDTVLVCMDTEEMSNLARAALAAVGAKP